MSGNDSSINGSSSQPEWYVMVEGERRGPYGLGAIQQMISLAQIDAESSVSRAGSTETMSLDMFDELRPLLEDAPSSESLPPVGDLPNFDAATELTDSARFAPPIGVAPPTETSLNTQDLDEALLEMASMAPPAPDHDPPPVPASAKVNAAVRKGSTDGLFAPQPDDLAPTDFDVPSGGARPATRKSGLGRGESVSGTIPLSERPTGARNENSLLFKIVESGGRVTATPHHPDSSDEDLDLSPQMKSPDSSGLLDISALANAGGGSAKVRPRRSKLDDILNVGNTGLGAPPGPTLLSPSLAPIPSRPPPAPASLAPPSTFNKTVVYTAAIVSVIVTFGVAATQVMLHRLDANQPAQVIVTNPPAPSGEPQYPSPVAPEAQPPGPSVLPSVLPAAPSVAPPSTAPIARPVPLQAPVVVAPQVAAPVVSTPTAQPTTPRVRTPFEPRVRTPSEPRVARAPTPPTPAVQAPVAAQSAPTVDPNLPAQPARETVANAMSDVAVVVRACGIQSATQVTITFVGSGRVTTASVGAPYAGTEIGSCVARAVRGARLPAFREAPLNVVYSFRP